MGLGSFSARLTRFFLVLYSLGINASEAKTPIKIAYVGGLTGNFSQSAQKSLKALKLVVKQFNEKGGIHGRPVEVLPYDNGFSPVRNISIFEKLKKEGAIAIVGIHASNDGLVLSKLAEENHFPLVVASATHPGITKDKKYVARVCFTDNAQGIFLAKHAYETLKARKAAIVVDVSDSFTDYLAKVFTKKFTALGGTIVGNYPIRTNDKDFSSIITALKNQTLPDVLFVSASAMESSYLVSHLTNSGVKVPLLGNDGWQNNDLGLVLKNMEQNTFEAFFTAHWYRDLSYRESHSFIRDFENEYEEKLSSFDADTVLTYDAGLLLLSALSKTSKLTPDSIMNQIRKTRISGVTGTIEFSGLGDPVKPVHLLRIAKGKLKVPGVAD